MQITDQALVDLRVQLQLRELRLDYCSKITDRGIAQLIGGFLINSAPDMKADHGFDLLVVFFGCNGLLERSRLRKTF